MLQFDRMNAREFNRLSKKPATTRKKIGRVASNLVTILHSTALRWLTLGDPPQQFGPENRLLFEFYAATATGVIGRLCRTFSQTSFRLKTAEVEFG